ncbi:MAG TPA: HlyD family efflux transporter periplasmic adaptor subunit [Chitinophagales bacterium]|nr:HlyD family efflux transporter periplasmic adaptor subunit [Chitinophagales bacterium]HNK99064.1 HlyD family efflux transporter periplasmic adaptor subunit [Chitinophagales bacterium]HNM29845.1 HlyD family efflux transporter periplasmic adaptor subunit [Chitinophagales bacterium]
MQRIIIIAGLSMLLGACSNGDKIYDATGTFEATEVIVSAGTAGKLLALNVEEGQSLEANAVAAIVDTTQLHLKKAQLNAQIQAVMSREPNIPTQIATIQEQIRVAAGEKQRMEILVKAGAAPSKQLDDIVNQIAVLEKQLDAQRTSLMTTAGSIYAEVNPLTLQIAQIDDQLVQSRMLNPIKGTVLTKYAETGEYTAPGKPVYKIADLTEMQLRAYVTGDQLPGIKIGQQVKVLVDSADGQYSEHAGTVSWISDKAEFTPKSIMTKDERANLVYAIKITVPNTGNIKIGMYGEVVF